MKSCRLLVCGALMVPGLLLAHGDEDHGAAVPAAPPTSQAARVEAVSEQFELVGSLQGDKLVVHLDRFATNEPVVGAKIDVEGGPLKAATAAEQDGVYAVPAAALTKPGTYPLVFTVQAGETADLLTGDLIVAGEAPVANSSAWPTSRWITASLAAAVIAGAGVFAWRRRRTAMAGVPR